jgi:FimV-like protein
VSKYSLSFILLLSLAFISTAKAADIKEYGPIKDGDSLWAIAKLLCPNDSYSVSRMMNLLFTYNPQAFINGNIDRLKKRAMVRVPDHLLSSSSEVISRSESITQSSQTTSVTPSKQVSVLPKPHPPKESTFNDKQKTLTQNTIETDLKAKIATLVKNNATKDHEIASLRRDLMALRQIGSKSMPVANASNTRQVQRLESAGQESSKSSTVRSEQVESESLSLKPDTGVAQDYVTSEQSESLIGRSNIDAIKIILFVGLGLGIFVLVMVWVSCGTREPCWSNPQ